VDPKLDGALQKLTDRVMGREGVTGTAIGEKKGKPCLKVYLSTASAGKGLPGEVDGFPVVAEVTGSFRRL
jgi:hypothetical protein